MSNSSGNRNIRTTDPVLFKLSDKLILRIPPEYRGSQRPPITMTRPPPIDQLPTMDFTSFTMFAPSFRGYAAEDAINQREALNEIDVQRIKVIEKEKAELYSWSKTLESINSSIAGGLFNSPAEYKYGLQCYRWNGSIDISCYGNQGESGFIDLSLLSVGSGKRRLVAYSVLNRYGGVQVQWSCDESQLPHWLAIHEQILKYIGEWNIVP